jgi:hypothetical protein
MGKSQHWYEGNMFWGPFSLGVGIVLTVVAAMRHDLRWLLLFAGACFVVAGWRIAKAIGRRVSLVTLLIAVFIAGGFWELYSRLKQEAVPPPVVQRADIRVKTLGITVMGQDRLPTLDVHFENKGSLSADVQSYYGVYTSGEQDSADLESRLFQRMLDESKKVTVRTYTVPGGSPRYMHYTGARPLTTEEERQIRSGRVAMYFIGKLVYRDALGWRAYEYCAYMTNEPRTFTCLGHNGPALP